MTYQTMCLIDFAQLVAVKPLNISATSYASVSMAMMLDNQNKLHIIMLALEATAGMLLRMEETLLMTYLSMAMRALVRKDVKKHLRVKMILTNLTNSCTTKGQRWNEKKRAEMSRDCQPFLFFNLKPKIQKFKNQTKSRILIFFPILFPFFSKLIC